MVRETFSKSDYNNVVVDIEIEVFTLFLSLRLKFNFYVFFVV